MYYYTEEDNRLMAAEYAAREKYEEGYKQGKRDAMSAIVHCRDCKMFRDGGNWPNCFAWGRNTDENGWCYLAERKDNG